MLRATVLAIPICSLLAWAAAPPSAPPEWMAGCWAGAGQTASEEQWMKPAGGMMLGMSRTVKGGRVVFHEFMTIEIKDGKLVFTARTGAEAKAVPFTAIKYSADEVVFENPEHDFPQRVIYRRTDAGAGMLGRIEGVEKGKQRAVDFPMKRIECAAAR